MAGLLQLAQISVKMSLPVLGLDVLGKWYRILKNTSYFFDSHDQVTTKILSFKN